MKPEVVTAANQERLKEGIQAFEALRALCKDPMKTNEALLLQIIRENENTEYGKKYDFQNIRSIREFQEKLPVTKYADYADYTKRMSQNGETNLICTYPIEHFNASSGTTGEVKFIPMSQTMMNKYLAYVTHSPYGVLADAIGDTWTGGRSIRLIESSAHDRLLPCGATLGSITNQMTKHFRSKVETLFTSPEEAIFPEEGTNTRYLHARFALTDPGATGILVIYLSFLVTLLRYIEGNWEMLADDIEKGTIDPSVELPPQVRDSILKKITPMPERAAELREIFAGGFDTPFVPKVWKNMQYVIGVGTGGFKMYADLLKSSYLGENIPIVKFGIVASEGTFTTAYRVDSDDTVLLPDSVFYEFLPLDAGDDFTKIVTIDGLEEGKEYELIITNFGGFYRYRMGDAVRVVSKFENTPTVEYRYRIDDTLNMLGERTTEEALRTAANRTAEKLSFDLIDFSVYADIKAVPPRYQYFLEIGKNPGNASPETIRQTLEEELSKTSPAMGHHMKDGLCQGLKVNFLQEEAYALWRDLAIYRGANTNQLKPVHIIRNERQRKFFFGMTDFSVEP